MKTFFPQRTWNAQNQSKRNEKKCQKFFVWNDLKFFLKLTEFKQGCLYGKDRYNFVKSKNKKTRFCRNLNEFNKKKFDKIVNEIIKRSFSYLERGNSKRS